MATNDERAAADTATETHHEPHGAAAPHGAADDVPGHDTEPGDGHGEHGAGEALGPVDVRAWTAGAVGVLLGLVMVVCLAVATGRFA